MREFAVPFNGDNSLLDLMDERGLVGRVREFYGTDGSFLAGGRHTPRLRESLGSFVRRAAAAGVEFDYLLNAINCEDYLLREGELMEVLRRLQDDGVTFLTVSHPVLLDQIRDSRFSFRINSSVNQFVNSLSKAKNLELAGYARLTLDEDRLRDGEFLTRTREHVGTEIEVLVNNCCINGCINRITHQLIGCSVHPRMDGLRRSREAKRVYEKCHRAFRADFLTFLRANWIRPEDLCRYREWGVNVFKLSGRTWSTEGIVKSLAAYARGEHLGNVLDYLKPDASGERYGFEFLSTSQVNEFFDHLWRGCRGGTCETCRRIATEVAIEIGFR